MRYELYFLALLLIFFIILVTIQYTLNKIYMEMLKIEDLIRMLKQRND